MRTLGLCAVVVLALACGSKKDKGKAAGSGSAAGSAEGSGSADGSDEEATAVEPDSGSGTPLPSTGKLRPTVDLAMTGAVTATVKGTAGLCSCKGDSASITLRSDDFKVSPSFDLNILVTSPEEWNDPAIIVNVKAPQRGSYGRNRVRHGDGEKMSFAKDCSAVTIDHALLKGIASRGDIVLKGLITCAP
jgi:hypothetical protein